ncbi:MAG TPA: hypothetical protein VFZ76_15760 [Anaerolineales bacterium]
MESDRDKMLKLMRFWLFGTFVIIFAAVTIYVGGALGLGLMVLQQPNYWLAMFIVAALSAAVYYVYRWYLFRSQ